MEIVAVTAIFAVLLGMLLPAVQQAREKSRLATCQSHLHQLALAMHAYEQHHRMLPSGQIPYVELGGGNGAGWAVQLLPMLGETGLFDDLDFSTDMTFSSSGQTNFDTAQKPLTYFLCPSDGRRHVGGRGAVHYAGNRGTSHSPDANEGVLFDYSQVSFAAIRDGLATTILLAEILPGEPDDPASTPASWCGWKMAHVVPEGPINEREGGPERFRSRHPNGVNALFCDGSVRFLSQDIAARFEDGRTRGVLGALLTRAGREPLNDRDF